MRAEQDNKGNLKGAQNGNFETQKIQRENVKNAKYSMYQSKQQTVNNLK